MVVRILGIDPGTQVVGFGCVEWRTARAPGQSCRVAESGSTSALRDRPLAHRVANSVSVDSFGGQVGARCVEAGVLRLGGRTVALEARLRALLSGMEELCERLAPDEVAVEEAFAGKSIQAALRIGEARGVVLAVAARCGIAVFQYPPASIKRVVAGHGGARKEAVADLVTRQVAGCPAGLAADATDALAVALCRFEAGRRPKL